MRALIDAWWPRVERGEVEAIVMTASGCGVTVKEYAHLLADDPEYRDKAARISSITKDLIEVIPTEDEVFFAEAPPHRPKKTRVAFQSPCTLQHGQQIRGGAEALLARAGYELVPVEDGHLCCGSAGAVLPPPPGVFPRRRAAQAPRPHKGGPPAPPPPKHRSPAAPPGGPG